MRVLFLDAFSGISGDMAVGAFMSLGLSVAQLREQLSRLPLTGYEISARERAVNGIVSIKFDVELKEHGEGHGAHHHDPHHHHEHGHRPYREIRDMIERSGLDATVREVSLAIFAVLAKAEGQIHGVAPDDVTFHEVGAVDSIVDIVAVAVGMQSLAVDAVYVSPLPLGSGVIRSQHGPIPVPAPATAELLRGFETRVGDGIGEMVTPTGAAIVAALAKPGQIPPLRLLAIGYGAGQRTLEDRPNVLRMILGELDEVPQVDEMVMVETNIDDLNPEIYEHVMERLFENGARDVYLTPVHMKKNRPGIILSVLCTTDTRVQLSDIVLSETSAIGLRYYPVQRTVLQRELIDVETVYGSVRVKIALAADGRRNAAPEYEDCKRLARQHDVPLKAVFQAATSAAELIR